MSKGAISFSNNDDWYTPKELVDRFGKFDYDPATTPKRAKILDISNYDIKNTDGLSSDWTNYKRIWINPPFTKKKEFLEKAWATYQQTGAEIYFLCPISFLTTKSFHNVLGGGRIYLPNGRVKFEKTDGVAESPAFGSVVIKIQDTWEIEPFEL